MELPGRKRLCTTKDVEMKQFHNSMRIGITFVVVLILI
jgi:hypothetical protein